MLIDSHCHLDKFPAEELAALLERAREAGVSELVTIGTTLPQSRAITALAESLENVWCAVGVHPHQAGDAEVPSPETVASLTASRKVIGIGETGLDYHYETAPHDVQQQSFRAHIHAARLSGLPVAIHARAADDDIATILEEETEKGAFGFLLHCFSSGRELAERAVALGGYLSFSGILTFPKSTELREIARDMPLDRLLVETDAPYLAPVPHRGKRNEPAWVRNTAAELASVRGLKLAELADVTTANFRNLFRRAA